MAYAAAPNFSSVISFENVSFMEGLKVMGMSLRTSSSASSEISLSLYKCLVKVNTYLFYIFTCGKNLSLIVFKLRDDRLRILLTNGLKEFRRASVIHLLSFHP
jgi:hypothetical protein